MAEMAEDAVNESISNGDDLNGGSPQLRSLAAENLQLRTRIAEVCAALKPFADYADARAKAPPDMQITTGSAFAKRQLTMGDCYAAAKALEKKP